MYQVSRPLAVIWSDIAQEKWFRVGLAIKLVFISLFVPTIHKDWFLPFMTNFIESPSFNPWNKHLEAGGLSTFPYGPIMVLAHLPTTYFGWLLDQLADTKYFSGLGFRLSILVSDLFILLALVQQHEEIKKQLIIFYWLSPLILFVNYWHGQADVIPVVLFLISIGLLKQARQYLGGLFLGLAAAAKHSIFIGIPFVFVYLWLRRGLGAGFRRALLLLVVTLLILEGPLLFSNGFLEMVIFNKESNRIFWLSLEMGENIFVYITPTLYIVLLYFTWRMQRINFDLLMATLGVSFSIIVIFSPAPPGWFVWLIPFYALHQSRSSGSSTIILVSALNMVFITYHLLFSSGALFLNSPLDISSIRDQVTGVFDGRFQSLLYTLLTGIGALIALQMLREGIRDNDYYRLGLKPLVVGIGGDSSTGKTTFAGALSRLFGNLSSVHLTGDDYHNWDRGSPMWRSITPLNPRANKLFELVNDLRRLLNGENVKVRIYNHATGRFLPAQKKKSRNLIFVSGLHALLPTELTKEMGVRFFLEVEESLRREWKIERDAEKRGRSREFTILELERRSEDAKNYIQPQAPRADVVFSLHLVNSDFLGTPEERNKLKLRVSIKSGIYYIDLTRVLIGICGLHININNVSEAGGVDLEIQGVVNGEDIALASRKLLPHLEELVDAREGFNDGMLGVMQLIALVEINESLMRRRRESA